MAGTSKMTLPSLERASKDLEEFEQKYQTSLARLSNLSYEVDKLTAEKLSLKTTIDSNKKTITFYQNLQTDMCNKIENIGLSQNKAKLVSASNSEKMKQVEMKLKHSKMQCNVFDTEVIQSFKLTNQQTELQSQIVQLESIISSNNKKMEELLNKIKQ